MKLLALDPASAKCGADAIPLLRLVLPLPPPEYCLNSRTHWAVKHKVNQEAQDIVRAALLETGQAGVRVVQPRALVTFRFPTKGRRDHDNFIPRLKPYWDALVTAGVLRDDDITTLGWPAYRHEYGQPGAVVIEIFEEGDTQERA